MEQGKAVRFWHKGADRMERLGACCDGDLRHACAALPQRLRGPVVVLFLNDEEDFTDAAQAQSFALSASGTLCRRQVTLIVLHQAELCSLSTHCVD